MHHPLRAVPSRRGALALLGPACLVLSTAGCDPPRPPLPPTYRPKVEVARVTRTTGARDLHLSGTLAAERSFSLGFATLGTVWQVKVQEGQTVRKGQLLAVLVQTQHADALGIARAKAAQAEDAHRRLLPMARNGTLPAVKLVEVETGLTQARLAVSMAERNLADTELRSPVAGIVARRSVEPGMSATPGFPAFTLVQTGTMLATAPIPELHVARLKPGATARVTVPALRRTLPGTVTDIAVAANPLTRTYDVKVSLPNPEGELRVGMLADVVLAVDEKDGGLSVPPEAVRLDDAGANYVFVVTPERKLRRRPVAGVRFVGARVTITGGVREGELVVTSGTPMLAEGMDVDLVPAPGAVP